MRFIHTSDWHIGRQFHNVSLLQDQQHVLDQLLGYIASEAVDALVIAGDIYDRSVPPAAAVELLDRVLNRVCSELGVPVILIPGNHDGAERLRFGARQLQQAGLHIIGDLTQMTTPVILSGKEDKSPVHFFGIPYNDPALVRDRFETEVSSHDEAHAYLIEQINAAATADHPRVLISHCFIDGAQESESERPLSIGGADRVSYEPFKAFDYVALGHLHSPQYKGESHIRYSGSILKYSFSEQHQNKGVTLVELDQGKVDPHAEDYLLVRLTDRHAILDPMGKLRAVYPNVLHLEKPGMLETGEQQLSRDQLKRGELEMFRDFFIQVSGQPLSQDQDAALVGILTELQQPSAAAKEPSSTAEEPSSAAEELQP